MYQTQTELSSTGILYGKYVIGFLKDISAWKISDNEFFIFRHDNNFDSEHEAVEYFKNNLKRFLEEEIRITGAEKTSYKKTIKLISSKGTTEFFVPC